MSAENSGASSDSDRRNRLRRKSEAWTYEDYEDSVGCGLHMREQVDAFYAVVRKVRDRGFEPVLYGGSSALSCDTVHIGGFPRRADGGYEIPDLLKGIQHQGRGMDFIDMTAPEGQKWVQWIGRDQTGQLVAFTSTPSREMLAKYEDAWFR